MNDHKAVLLGSRSPRRLELLRLIVPAGRIVVVPPVQADEAGFAGADTFEAIESRLREVARAKCDDVLAQLHSGAAKVASGDVSAVLTADTVIIASGSAGRPVVLGQPPGEATWRETVRTWFHEHLLGRTHRAATAVCAATPGGRVSERTVTTAVTFHAAPPELVDWYIGTGEPVGKAGGYALQGAGSVFVSRVEGSHSNVVGLPLWETMQMLSEVRQRSEARGQRSEVKGQE